MQQKLYIQIRSRTSLWAERAKTSRMPTMATSTFFETVKHNNPLTSSQSLLLCSQVKADATETLIQMCSRTSLWAERATASRMITMATCTFFQNIKHKHPLTNYQSWLLCSQVKADATETPHTNAFANVKDDDNSNMNICWNRQTQKPANQPLIMASLLACDRNTI